LDDGGPAAGDALGLEPLLLTLLDREAERRGRGDDALPLALPRLDGDGMAFVELARIERALGEGGDGEIARLDARRVGAAEGLLGRCGRLVAGALDVQRDRAVSRGHGELEGHGGAAAAAEAGGRHAI